MEQIAELKQTWLIQRLRKAHPKGDSGILTFGGGIRYGGFSKEAFDMLNTVFRFDYMGACEFERGAVQNAVYQMYEYFQKGYGVSGQMTIGSIPVYYVCYKPSESKVKERIKDLRFPRKIRLKEYSLFDEALASRVPDNIVHEKKDKYAHYRDYVGWLELDNDFAFFVDKETFDNFVKLMTPEPQISNSNKGENL